MGLFNNVINFGIAAGLLMIAGLLIVSFFNWIDNETKPKL